MSPQALKGIAIGLLVVLALPTGLCSLYFTPMGLISAFSHDPLGRFVGELALICSAIGWAICGVAIWGAVRLTRSARRESPPSEPAP